jgi:single-strand DNA-binding protein
MSGSTRRIKMINSVVLAGNLTRDAELKQTRTGTSVLNFGVAVNERVKNNQTGEWSDRPNFFECVIFGKRAESLSKYLHKGLKVTVSGHLRYNQWENEQGQKRSNVNVVVDDIEFMSQRDSQGQQNGSKQTAGGNYASNQEPDVFEDDIPF